MGVRPTLVAQITGWLMLYFPSVKMTNLPIGLPAKTAISTQIPPRQVESPLVNYLCNAQCASFCQDAKLPPSLDPCQTNITLYWVLSCYESEAKTQDPVASNGAMLISTQCRGTCSVLQTQELGYIPPIPEIIVSKDIGTRGIVVSWKVPHTPHAINYVIEEKDDSSLQQWIKTHVVNGDNYTLQVVDICKKPTYRVASVSRYGSYYFSKEVTAPDLVPGPPVNFHFVSVAFVDAYKEFWFTLKWYNPVGWELYDLDRYQVEGYYYCPYGQESLWAVFYNTSYVKTENIMTLRVADYGIGCKVIISVNATSRCNSELISPPTTINITLTCALVKNVYNGSYCPEKFDPPGNVHDVRIKVVPSGDGRKVKVMWQPPTDLGSSQKLETYIIFYGRILNGGLISFDLSRLQNISVPADRLQMEIPFPHLKPREKFGILVMAGAPGQIISYPIGMISELTYSDREEVEEGEVLIDQKDGVLLYAVSNPPAVRLYVSNDTQGDTLTGGYAVQVGKVTRRDLLSILNSTTKYNQLEKTLNGKDVLNYIRNQDVNQTKFDNVELEDPDLIFYGKNPR